MRVVVWVTNMWNAIKPYGLMICGMTWLVMTVLIIVQDTGKCK